MQLAIADIVFVWYAIFGVQWNIPPTVISTWLGATVVQVIGVVVVVARALFADRSSA